MPEQEYDASADKRRDAEKYAEALTEYDINVGECSLVEKQTLLRQESFLAAFAEVGVINAACRAVNISDMTVRRWRQGNIFEFTQCFEDARLRFCDFLESMALKRVKAQKPNDSPLLLITLLNANIPEKYRNSVVVVEDKPKQVLEKLSGRRKAKVVEGRWSEVKPEEA